MASSARSESGYALASVLLVVTILTCVAGSILMLQFIQRRQALDDIARVKAIYAAESGIAQMLASIGGPSDLPAVTGVNRRVEFPDGSSATVDLSPWGMFVLARSEGSFRTATSTRTALIAQRPPEAFQNALVFANPRHQLVFAGSSSITGNVLLGQPGATTGNLGGRRSPPRLPITGMVRKEVSPRLPSFRSDILRAQFFRSLTTSLAVRTGVLDLTLIPDSVEGISLQGTVTLTGRIIRRGRPLWLTVDGDVLIGEGSSMQGLVALRASGDVKIERNVVLEYALLMSGQSVRIGGQGKKIAQVIAPVVHVDSGTTLRYPSAVVSIALEPGIMQDIVVGDGASIEGFVGILGDGVQSSRAITIEPAALIIGAAYADGSMTLDGRVVGSVLTREFAFYEAPTQYLGWLRSAVIDRVGLPDAYLVPPGFTQNIRLDILDWL